MKPSKPADLRQLTDAELEQQIINNQRSLVDMQFNMAVGTLENPSAMRVLKRDIARMKTILNQRSKSGEVV
ncbi:MAG: 50S ribosomal protein L29 [Ignavibacteriae bacterium]|nr:50S ribosomal protein L29 [Ignavibacteriota bacterium]MCB9216306.1 50S ribosomal protein L29 [Ignavibacteria bacterium]